MIISRRIGNDADTSVWIYQPELNSAIEAISKSQQDIILRITAAGNLVRGEPIRTSLSLYPNNAVYAKGEHIISKSYDINSEKDAENIVQDFLYTVNRTAVNKGVLTDPISGSVGVISGEQLYSIIDSISSVRGKVYLTAYAQENTTSIGPLKLNIKVVQKNGN